MILAQAKNRRHNVPVLSLAAQDSEVQNAFCQLQDALGTWSVLER